MTDNATERFTDRAEDYARFRPGYPAAILDVLRDERGLTPESVVADIGAGTGLLARLFLENGNVVIGIEPNAAMREIADRLLAPYPRFRSRDGMAEETGLAASSVDFVTAGQAFHWFDFDRAQAEFRRILRPGGVAVLVWNGRRTDTSPWAAEYEDLIRRFSPDHAARQILAKHPAEEGAETVGRFFAPGQWALVHLHHQQSYDWDALRGLTLSFSYTPALGHPDHAPFLQALRRLFDTHQQGGTVTLDYETWLYHGGM